MSSDTRPYGGFSAQELNAELGAVREQLAMHLASNGDASDRLWFKRTEAMLRASIRAMAAEVHMQAIEEYTALFPDRQMAHTLGCCQAAQLWDGFRRWDERTKRP